MKSEDDANGRKEGAGADEGGAEVCARAEEAKMLPARTPLSSRTLPDEILVRWEIGTVLRAHRALTQLSQKHLRIPAPGELILWQVFSAMHQCYIGENR
jgi:hypothetical protein